MTLLLPYQTHIGKVPEIWLRPLPASVFDYPFFDEGVAATPNEEGAGAVLDDRSRREIFAGLSVAAFIFHVGHCGSTLLSQMFATSPRCRVVSEPEAVNGVLLSAVFHDIKPVDFRSTLKRVLQAYTVRAGPEERWVVFKFPSWAVHFLPDIRALYPDASVMFLDRDTQDVVASLLTSGHGFTDWWSLPSDVLWRRFLPGGAAPQSKADYIRQMVEAARSVANAHDLPAFTYPDFLDAFEQVLAAVPELDFSEDETRAALERARYQSKSYARLPYTAKVKA